MGRFVIRPFVMAVLLMGILSAVCFAEKAPTELNSVEAYDTVVDGRDVYRIEIGMRKEAPEYKTGVRSFRPNTLVVDLDKTIPGRLRHEAWFSGTAQRMTVQEVRLQHTQLNITMDRPIEELEYNIYVKQPEKKAKKPLRLIIDVYKTAKKKPMKGIKGRHIVLDAGHGGSDTGAVGPNGLTEKEATLAVTQKTRDLLKASGAYVTMTRDSDRDVYGVNASDVQELQARVNAGMRDPDAEIFVSIHCNAFSSPSAHGTESYYYRGSQKGYRLASLLNEEMIGAGGLANRGVKEAGFYVLKHSSVPASLVELAFITNYAEERLLADEGFRGKMAEAIARGISRYFSDGK